MGQYSLDQCFGSLAQREKNLATVLGGSVASALVFFIVSNFGAWLNLYPHTVDGLRQCYILAIPFFRSTLVSSVAYSLVFYTVYAWILKRCQGTVLARLV